MTIIHDTRLLLLLNHSSRPLLVNYIDMLYIQRPPVVRPLSAGSGKTEAIIYAAQEIADRGGRVLIGCPTGVLISTYRSR